MRPRTVKWLARPSLALAQALVVVGPFSAFGQATSGLACGWLQSPTLWWDRFTVAFWQRHSACLDLGACIWSL